MDGENNGNDYEQMDGLGGFPIFLETPMWIYSDKSQVWVGTPIVSGGELWWTL